MPCSRAVHFSVVSPREIPHQPVLVLLPPLKAHSEPILRHLDIVVTKEDGLCLEGPAESEKGGEEARAGEVGRSVHDRECD